MTEEQRAKLAAAEHTFTQAALPMMAVKDILCKLRDELENDTPFNVSRVCALDDIISSLECIERVDFAYLRQHATA